MCQTPSLPVDRRGNAPGGPPKLVMKMGRVGVTEAGGDVCQALLGPQDVPAGGRQRAGPLDLDGGQAFGSEPSLSGAGVDAEFDVKVGHFALREGHEVITSVTHQAGGFKQAGHFAEVAALLEGRCRRYGAVMSHRGVEERQVHLQQAGMHIGYFVHRLYVVPVVLTGVQHIRILVVGMPDVGNAFVGADLGPVQAGRAQIPARQVLPMGHHLRPRNGLRRPLRHQPLFSDDLNI